jgi:dipeptidyl-peptidase-4
MTVNYQQRVSAFLIGLLAVLGGNGRGNNNVHYQSTEQLVHKFTEPNKTFDLVIYLDRSHSINEKKNTKRHLYGLMTDFLHEKLPPNTKPEPRR